MKRLIATTALTAGALIPAWAHAETIHSVTQVSYDGAGRPVCTAVRMNPAAYGAIPSDACALGTESTSFGPDRITKNTYDDAGQLLQVDQAYGTSVQRAYARYTYTANGKKATEKDANGNLTTLEYDGFDRPKILRHPNVAIGSGTSSTTDYEQYSYDANDNRLTWRRRNGATVNYTYDKLNRVTLEDQPAITDVQTATEKDVYTAYDGLGHIASKRFASTSGDGVSYGYDSLGRVNSTTDMYGRTVGYTYNSASARNTMTYHGGVVQSYTLDNLNRLTGSTVGGSNFTLGYDSLGRMTSVSRNNSTTTAYGYDNLGRLTSMGHDLTGTANDVTWNFTGRNPASQITSWTATSTTYDYKEKASSTVNTGYDGLNRDTAIAILPGGYDANGNLARETTQSDPNAANKRCMTYDTMNRLLKVTKCSTPSVADLTLTYDPEGRLAAYTANLTTTEFLYDGLNLIAEYTHSSSSGHGSDGMTRRYVHGTGTDQPLLWFVGATVSTGGQFYVTNYQGSIIGNSNTSGNLTELYKYGPYGEPTNAQGDEFWSGARFRYTGQYIIPEAKLYYYKARVYDPYYGRFLQTDPIGSDDDLNLYAYLGGDPINQVDPLGLFAEEDKPIVIRGHKRCKENRWACERKKIYKDVERKREGEKQKKPRNTEACQVATEIADRTDEDLRDHDRKDISRLRDPQVLAQAAAEARSRADVASHVKLGGDTDTPEGWAVQGGVDAAVVRAASLKGVPYITAAGKAVPVLGYVYSAWNTAFNLEQSEAEKTAAAYDNKRNQYYACYQEGG